MPNRTLTSEENLAQQQDVLRVCAFAPSILQAAYLLCNDELWASQLKKAHNQDRLPIAAEALNEVESRAKKKRKRNGKETNM